MLDPTDRFLTALESNSPRRAQAEKDQTVVRHVLFTHNPPSGFQCFDDLVGNLWRNDQIPGTLRIGQLLACVELGQRGELRRRQPLRREYCRQTPEDKTIEQTDYVRKADWRGV